MIRSKLFIYWLCVFIVAAFILINSQFKSTNDDSNYYTDQVLRAQGQNWQFALTPKWGINYYSYDPTSYMRDQLPGQLLMGLAVSKLGIPARHALHLLEMIFQLLSLFLLVQIACQFLTYENSSVLFYAIILTPMAFSYNLRANHEVGVMFFCFLSLYAGLKLSSSKYWGIVTILSSVMVLFIKGPFFIFTLALTSIGHYFSQERASFKTLSYTLFLSLLVVAFSAYGFELLFLKITGLSFFSEFYKIQIQQRAMQITKEHSFIVQKILNFYYYFYHYLIYSLVWSLITFIVIIKNFLKNGFRTKLASFLKSPLSNCFLLSSFVFCLFFAMSDRTATRYVFPAYYLFSAWVIFLLYHLSADFRKIHLRVTKWGLHFVAPSLWFLAFALHFRN